MIPDLMPYKKYSITDTPWFDKLPMGWRLARNGAILNLQKRRVGQKSSDFTLLSLTLGGIIPRDLDNPQGKFPDSFDTYKVVHPKNLILCLFDIDETPRTIGISSYDGMITGAYTVVECREIAIPKYYVTTQADK